MPNTNHKKGDQDRDVRRAEESDVADKVRAEVEAMHEFLVAWFTGAVANDDDVFQRGFARRFDPGLVLIPPAGNLLTLAGLTKAIRGSHGSNPEFRIAIRDVVLRRELPGLVLVTYQEWQRNAKASTPANNGRVSTALLRPEAVAPGGFAWLHVHECWLPSEIMSAGPYEF
ncbi:hypothetical protein [Enhygromyxa salina]|uniref:Sucrose-phosphatase C-terminal domain-containing protein n=1 Tax=Enhygromyxa salina TaxID=215803 RepID=A0A2S9YTK6_9BACT|nr:hypothetical protein [Enhygromyxa salina]PRQ08447.1 hypothetical protein ENSA7_17320 [Enhygromyxa salina]